MTSKRHLIIKRLLGTFSSLPLITYSLIRLKESRFQIEWILLAAFSVIVYETYRLRKEYLNTNVEVIYLGFKLKSYLWILVGAASYLLCFFEMKSSLISFSFCIGTTAIFVALSQAYQIIVINLTKMTVTGLLDDSEQSLIDLNLESITKNGKSKLKITGRDGFFEIDKANYTESSWCAVNELLTRYCKTTQPS